MKTNAQLMKEYNEYRVLPHGSFYVVGHEGIECALYDYLERHDYQGKKVNNVSVSLFTNNHLEVMLTMEDGSEVYLAESVFDCGMGYLQQKYTDDFCLLLSNCYERKVDHFLCECGTELVFLITKAE